MSRSRRKTPIHGVTAAISEAVDKAAWHRRWRHGEKQRLTVNPFAEPINHLGYSNKWGMSKDGKVYRPDMPDWLKRK